MVDDSSVNDQVTDSVTQNISLLTGSAASQGVGMVDVVSAETIGMFMHNAITSQQNSQLTSNASVTATCARMLSIQPEIPRAEEMANLPFLPLATDGSPVSPEDLLNQAQALVETAVKSIDEKKTTNGSAKQAIDKMIKKLKGTST